MSDTTETNPATETVAAGAPAASVQSTAQVPSIGRIVHYVLDNGRYPGVHRPAMIVKVLDDHPEDVRVQLQVFTDGINDFDRNQPGASGMLSRESVRYDESMSPNSWHWPEKA